ncbi:hypothetical protein SDC9_132807 [bioreactor metagenome]|uniref:Uncharacterized protein n=1 Tax=bioreactor metagenome TaxID=1076179 RepID=A0A645D8K8_9ZZZZ
MTRQTRRRLKDESSIRHHLYLEGSAGNSIRFGRNAAIFDRYDRDRGAFGLPGDLGKAQRSEMAAGNRP